MRVSSVGFIAKDLADHFCDRLWVSDVQGGAAVASGASNERLAEPGT